MTWWQILAIAWGTIGALAFSVSLHHLKLQTKKQRGKDLFSEIIWVGVICLLISLVLGPIIALVWWRNGVFADYWRMVRE